MTRRASRLDDNQTAIVEALRAIGCSVQSLAAVGEGCPDILVGSGGSSGFIFVAEIKDPSKPIADQALTPKQKQWHRDWEGPAHLIRTVDQALALVDFYRHGEKAAKRRRPPQANPENWEGDIAW